MRLHRYWLRFETADPLALPPGVALGCGVTAFSREDALSLVQETVFRGQSLPEIASITKGIDISKLDANHVLPNMGNVVLRGVWFPLGYS